MVLLSSRAFHIHSRRSRPTGTNWIFTPAPCSTLFIALLLRRHLSGGDVGEEK
jgi:hypothetical protein